MDLQKFSFYQDLEDLSLKFFKKHLQPINIKKNNILFFQGDICENILFLTNGIVRLYIQSKNADEITLYQLNEGEQCIVNTASTISQTEAIGTAITVTDIKGYLLDAKSAKELAHMSYIYQNFLFSIYTLRMQSLTQLVNDLKFKKLDERILDWIKKQNVQVVETTHEHIANELGTTRVVVSRLLKELERNRKISLMRGYITLL